MSIRDLKTIKNTHTVFNLYHIWKQIYLAFNNKLDLNLQV